jgi:toxin HigB-1
VIKSFLDGGTHEFWDTGKSKGMPPSNLRKVALKKLAILHAATTLEDLRIPPGNRLERLVGDRRGQHSIRINEQFRLCFEWHDGNAYDVEITDYH